MIKGLDWTSGWIRVLCHWASFHIIHFFFFQCLISPPWQVCVFPSLSEAQPNAISLSGPFQTQNQSWAGSGGARQCTHAPAPAEALLQWADSRHTHKSLKGEKSYINKTLHHSWNLTLPLRYPHEKCQTLFPGKDSPQAAATSRPVLCHLPQPGQQNIHLNSRSVCSNAMNLFQVSSSDVMHFYCTKVCHVVPEISQRQAK